MTEHVATSWSVLDEGYEDVADHLGVFVLEFHGRPTLAVLQQAVNEHLRALGVDPNDVKSISPVLSLHRREVWYYKGSAGD